MFCLLAERAETDIHVMNFAMRRNTVMVLTKHRLDTSEKRMVIWAEVNPMSALGPGCVKRGHRNQLRNSRIRNAAWTNHCCSEGQPFESIFRRGYGKIVFTHGSKVPVPDGRQLRPYLGVKRPFLTECRRRIPSICQTCPIRRVRVLAAPEGVAVVTAMIRVVPASTPCLCCQPEFPVR